MSRMFHSSVTKVAAFLYLLVALSFPQHAEAVCNIWGDTAYQWSDLTPIIVPPSGAETTYSSVPDLATDRVGVWGALFQSYDQEEGPGLLLFSRSTDNGETWTTASDLIQSTSESVVRNSEVLATDGKGVWLAAWQREVEPESHVYFSRSVDNGLSWSTATLLPGVLPEHMSSSVFDLDTNRKGTWIITWSAVNEASEQQTFVSRSQDN